MLAAALISCGVVFLAELGDKSQLITMTYALRHRWWVVLTGVAVAAFLVHGISVTVGHFLGLTLPARPIAAIAGIAFLGFGLWMLLDEALGWRLVAITAVGLLAATAAMAGLRQAVAAPRSDPA